MTRVSEEAYLAQLFASLKIISPEEFQLGGHNFQLPKSDGRTSGGHDQQLANMHAALVEVLYVNYFARRFTGAITSGLRAGGSDLAETISRANTGKTRHEVGWDVEHVENNGSVVARRADRIQTFLPGQYLAQDERLPISQGSKIAVLFPREIRGSPNGFHFCLSEAASNIADESYLVRLYWNITRIGVGALVSSLTGRLNGIRLPFRLKIVANSEDCVRCDAAVLYICRRHFEVTMAAIMDIINEIAPYLEPGTPLFTKCLMPGIAVAEDPGDGQSFGQSRCQLLVDAVLRCWQEGREDVLSRFRALENAFSAAGLLIDQPFLRSLSTDVYFLPAS